jgi:hypothetical protein
MKRRKKIRRVLSTSRRLLKVMVFVALVSFVSGQRASAEIEITTVDDIINDYLDVVDIESLSTAMRVTLRSQIQEAVKLGAINEETYESLGYGNDDNEMVTPSTIRDRDQLRDRLTEQIQRWETIGPDWVTAFVPVRERTRTCWESPTTLCRTESRLLLQWNHMLQVTKMFDQRIQNAFGDEKKIGEIVASMERARLRIQAILTNGESAVLQDVGVPLQEMLQMQNQLQEMNSNRQTNSPSTTSPSTNQKGK